MDVNQALSNIYTAVSGVTVPVQSGDSTTLKATPIVPTSISYYQTFTFYRHNGGVVSASLSTIYKYTNIKDVNFSIKNWGKLFFNNGYFRGSEGLTPLCVLTAGSTSFMALIKSIDDTDVTSDDLSIGIFYDTANEKLKMCSFTPVGSGKYYYCTNITPLAGKTVEVLNGSSNTNWSSITYLCSMNVADNRNGVIDQMATLEYSSIIAQTVSRPLLNYNTTNIVCDNHGFIEKLGFSHPNLNRLVVEITSTDASNLVRLYTGGFINMGPEF